MRLRLAGLLAVATLAGLASTSSSVLAAGGDVLLRATVDGAIIRIPGAKLEDCRLVDTAPPRIVLEIAHLALRSRVLANDSESLRSVRVVGPEVLGEGTSRVVVEVASTALEPHLEAAREGVLLVISSRPAELRAAETAPVAEPPPTRHAAPAPAEEEPAPPRPEKRPRNEKPAPAPASPAEVEAPEPAEAEAAPEPAPEASGPARGPREQPFHEDRAGMVVVPGGDFVMGSVEGTSFPDEAPPHPVRLRAYRIDAREVTVDEFAKSPLPLPRQPEWSEDPNDPVVNVTWHEADEYCRWENKRLPSESEWERAARGTDRRTYAWGDEWNARLANSGIDGDGQQHLARVGSYPDGMSPAGALDMAGNAWEWTADWYDREAYENARTFEPDGPGRGSHKVARGGSFRSTYSTSMTTTVRLPLPPGARRDDVGFRCASSQ